MDKQIAGTVAAARKQWWLKINTKPARTLGTDGASYPYVIRVTYSVDGKEYSKRKWIHAGCKIPEVGSAVQVKYCSAKPAKAKLVLSE